MAAERPIDFPLPPNLPKPADDGMATHLMGMPIPPISLRSTKGRSVALRSLGAPRTVIYCYPMTGVPGKPLPEGWDLIPGARGCTPQTCGFRDHYQELKDLKAEVLGLSTQTTEYQREAVTRLHLPFALLRDKDLALARALRLPTFEFAWGFGSRRAELIKRLTLVLRDGRIEHVFYRVFPPNMDAERVGAWLAQHPR